MDEGFYIGRASLIMQQRIHQALFIAIQSCLLDLLFGLYVDNLVLRAVLLLSGNISRNAIWRRVHQHQHGE
jgi:hypothetical protein